VSNCGVAKIFPTMTGFGDFETGTSFSTIVEYLKNESISTTAKSLTKSQNLII